MPQLFLCKLPLDHTYSLIVGEAGYRYAAQWKIFDAWAAEHLDQAQTEALAGRTTAKVFGFDQPISKL
jgi:hypothetical protein